MTPTPSPSPIAVPVAVTGIGLFTPAGDGTAATWERVLKALPTCVVTRLPDPREGVGEETVSSYLSCPAPPFAAERLGTARHRRLDRCVQFALLAAVEAVRDAGIGVDPHTLAADWDADRTAVLAGTGAGCVTAYDAHHLKLRADGPAALSPFAVPSSLPNSIAAQVSIALQARGPSTTVGSACAAGATALGLAADLLRLGRCDTAVVVGTDALLTPFHLAGFDRIGALSHRLDDPAGAPRPFDADRDGFVAGEGAGVLVLERAEHAAARGARVRARLLGHGSASEAYNAVRPRDDGSGLTAAVRAALADARLDPADIGYVNAHATGTPQGDEVEAAALARLLPHRPPVSSTKGVTGHLFGAAGTVEAALTALAVAEGTAPPTANLAHPSPGTTGLHLPTAPLRLGPVRAGLSVSAGFGGHNAALVLAPA
ncbi:beta-ketoacyl-[acyl-carrier-protein] synthase family protein [Kitasatospora saccharophila]|uniref:beta-ketoacyl-[acyl-carrier-protein] synthase family protein n=1 Tax=Kitasatospora saccharophila TaxID=407973 RepID=UPI0031DAE7F4